MINLPETKNIVKLEVFDKNDNIIRTYSGDNYHTAAAINTKFHDNNSILSSGSNSGFYPMGLIVGGSGALSSSNYYTSAIRYLMISNDNTPIDYANPQTNLQVTGTKILVDRTSITADSEYIHNSVRYIANIYEYNFGYGQVNMEIFKLMQCTGSTVSTGSPVSTCFMIPSGFVVNNDERLRVTYVHLFDVDTYYNDGGSEYNLKDEYKEIELDSGTFLLDVVPYPYNVKAKYLFNETISKTTQSAVVWTIGKWPTSNTNRTYKIHYGSSQTYDYIIDMNNPDNVWAYTTNAEKTEITRTLTVKFAPSLPELTNITKIEVPNGGSPTHFGSASNPIYVEFPTPWTKPVDTEFTIQLQWVETIEQQT